MKTSLAFALAALLGSLTPALADIPAPKPVSITVSNTAAFPQYKFSYRSTDPKVIKSIVDGQTFTALDNVDLLIKSGDEPPQTWEIVKYNWRGAKVNIKVEGVKQQGKQLSVTFKTSGDDAAPGKRSAGAGSAPWFVFAGLSACALVVVARRRKV